MGIKAKGDNYVIVTTTTAPACIPVQVAALLTGLSAGYINQEIERKHLNYGYAFAQDVLPTGSEELVEHLGQKVIVLDELWTDWFSKKINQPGKNRKNPL